MSLHRLAFKLKLRPGTEEEYRKRHAEVWPDVLEALKLHGISNYSIYICKETVFAYMEADGDPKEKFSLVQREPASCRWRDYMSDIIIRDEQMGFHYLNEAFHLG